MEKSGSVRLPLGPILQAADPDIARRVQEADVNQDGELSRDEVLQVFVSELRARKSRRRMAWGLAAVAGLLLLALAANAGLTWAVVSLSRETEVAPSGVLLAKGSGAPIKTAPAVSIADGFASWLWLTRSNVTLVHSIMLPLDGDGSFAWHQVTGVEVRPGNRTTVYTASGAVVTITPEGAAFSAMPGGGARPGRALLSAPFPELVGCPYVIGPPPLEE